MPDFYLNLNSTAQLFEYVKGMKKKVNIFKQPPRCLSLLISTTLIWNTSDIKHLLTFMSCERRGSMGEPYAQRWMNWQSLQWRRDRSHWGQTGRGEWAPLSPSGCEDLLCLTPVGTGSTTACEKRVCFSLLDGFDVELPVCVLYHTQVCLQMPVQHVLTEFK